jgi:hypothetical protein
MSLKHIFTIIGFVFLLTRGTVFCQSTQQLTPTKYSNIGPMAKRSWQLGGGASFSVKSGKLFKDYDGHAVLSYDLSPSFGYFIANGLKIGVDFSFSSSSHDDIRNQSMGMGPCIAFYFGGHDGLMMKGRSIPYVSLGTIYSVNSIYCKSEKILPDNSGLILNSDVGLNMMLSNAVSLVGAIRMAQYFKKVVKFGIEDRKEFYYTENAYGYDISLFFGVSCFIWN